MILFNFSSYNFFPEDGELFILQLFTSGKKIFFLTNFLKFSSYNFLNGEKNF